MFFVCLLCLAVYASLIAYLRLKIAVLLFIPQISNYVESRFNKDKINCMTNTFVTEVEEMVLHTMDAVTKEKSKIPYGMCVWAAGIAPRPITKTIISKVDGQTNRLANFSFNINIYLWPEIGIWYSFNVPLFQLDLILFIWCLIFFLILRHICISHIFSSFLQSSLFLFV